MARSIHGVGGEAVPEHREDVLELAAKGLECPEYVELVEFLRSGKELQDVGAEHPARLHASNISIMGVEDTPSGPLVMVDGSRVMVPASERRRLVELLHSTHLSDRTMLETARRIWYWSGMKEQIKGVYRNCEAC